MPRYQPPKNYYTSTQVKKILNISGAMIANYVEKGKIKHIVPPGRTHGFYLKSDVDRLANEINAFFNLEEESDNVVLKIATEGDVDSCIKLNKELFADKVVREESIELLTRKWVSLVKENPEVIYVLKKEQDAVGILTIIPFKPNQAKIHEILYGDTSILLGDVNISSEDIEKYEAGKYVQPYIAGIGIKPDLDKNVKRKYGAKLIAKFIDVLVELGERGVIIEKMMSVGSTQSGRKLLQHFGFCEIISQREDTRMFMLDMINSGAPVAVNYREALKKQQSKEQ